MLLVALCNIPTAVALSSITSLPIYLLTSLILVSKIFLDVGDLALLSKRYRQRKDLIADTPQEVDFGIVETFGLVPSHVDPLFAYLAHRDKARFIVFRSAASRKVGTKGNREASRPGNH